VLSMAEYDVGWGGGFSYYINSWIKTMDGVDYVAERGRVEGGRVVRLRSF
jgi:hypothetical protein